MIGNWNYGTGLSKSSVARVFMKKVTGQILANGAVGNAWGYGSGGAIRLVANRVAGTGTLSVFGYSFAGDGRIRVHERSRGFRILCLKNVDPKRFGVVVRSSARGEHGALLR